MEEWRTDITRGLWVGIALIVGIFLLDIGLVWLLINRWAVHLGTFVSMLALVASLGLIGLIAYWLFGLVDSGYFLDRNQVIIHWGPNEQIIPTGSIERVITGEELPGAVRIAGGIWPGHIFGHGEIVGVGPALFYATVPPRQQLYLVTPGLTYGISPAERAAFLEALRRRLEMGPTQVVEQSSRRPGFLAWAIWRNRAGLALLGTGLVATLALTAALCMAYPSLPYQVALHFDAAGVPHRADPRGEVFILPLIGFLAFAANGALGWLVSRRDRVASTLLWSGALVVQALTWLAAVGVLARH